MRRFFAGPAFALAFAFTAAAHAQLSDVEQRIVAAVRQRSPAALELLERAARINSGTLNVEGVRAVGDIFRAELDALGFRTRWVDMPAAMKRAGHLAATREGSQGQRLLLLGHLDTVFEKDSAVATWQRSGERVRGQGVNDMKGGDVVLVEALRALHASGALDNTRIQVLLTGDEERTGAPVERARAELVAMAKGSDLALSFEGGGRATVARTARVARTTAAAAGPGAESAAGGGATGRVASAPSGSANPVASSANTGTAAAAATVPAALSPVGGGASISRRSTGGWSLAVHGRPGHSSAVFSPQLGYGAIYEAARILNAFREQLIEPDLTFNVGVMAGGTGVAFSDETATGTVFGKSNVIPRDVIVRGDLRYLTPDQGEKVKRHMREIVAAHLPGTTAEISFRDTFPPQPPTDAARRLLGAYSKASEDAGLGRIVELPPGNRGSGDVQFAAPFIPGLDGLGTTGSGSHTDDEDMEIASLERGAIRAAILIYRLTRP